MGFAVNASTMGMAVSGLAVALFQPRDRPSHRHSRQPRLAVDSDGAAGDRAGSHHLHALRIAQGFFMAAAFTLTLAYLGEQYSAADAAGAFAAYITGNVASNLFGRLISAARGRPSGPRHQFLLLRRAQPARRRAGLFHCARTTPDECMTQRRRLATCRLGRAPAQPAATRGFAIGFCILFAFIGTFTYVNFVLMRAAARRRRDAARLRLFRLPPVHFHHAAGRPRG